MLCKVTDCSRNATRKKMCELHYRRLRINGSTGPANPLRERHGMYYSTEYGSWSSMLSRCFNKKSKDYINYGGRGITVCKQWRESFSCFYKDVGVKPSQSYSLDRIDVNGNYEPGNVRWATRSVQNRNKRPSKNKTGLTGAYFDGSGYSSSICVDYKVHYLGHFKTAKDAHLAYTEAKRKLAVA